MKHGWIHVTVLFAGITGCTYSSFNAKLDAAKLNEALDAQVAGVSLAPGADTNVPPDTQRRLDEKKKEEETCEVTLKLQTFDEGVLSDAVCIKRPGQGVVIPKDIALSVNQMVPGKQFAVDPEVYCRDEKSAVGQADGRGAGEDQADRGGERRPAGQDPGR